MTSCIGGDPGDDLRYASDPVYAVDVSHWEGPVAYQELECMWSAGVRHLIAGTQVEEVTRQQLAMAVRRGYSIDAYVYLYWNSDVREQVREAFRRVDGFDIGRMWLDVEEAGGAPGANTLAELVQAAVDECRAIGTADCGIYTGPGYWKSYLNNTTRFAEVPLWYAWYNDRHELSAWSIEKFGGWTAPAGKQWAEEALCSVGVDKNTMLRLEGPALTVDRTVPPAPTTVPAAPVGLWPSDYLRTHLEMPKLTADTIPHADRYELKLETWRGSGWVHYVTFPSTVSYKKFTPIPRDSLWRFSARARNVHGWGDWSAPAYFETGTYAGRRPSDWGTSPPPPDPPPPPAPAPDAAPPSVPPDAAPPVTPPDAAPPAPDAAPDPGPDPVDPLVPVLVSPAEGSTFARAAAVRMACEAVESAAQYRFEVEYLYGGNWTLYHAYTPAAPFTTFYPQAVSSYRWRVQAKVGGAWGPWSETWSFTVR